MPLKCECCGGSSISKKWQKNGYAFLECKACDLIWIDPLPSDKDIAGCYERDFFLNAETGYRDYERELRWRRINYLRDMERIENFAAGGRLLDVGCATGAFLDVCSERWERYGQEISSYAGGEAQKKYGENIVIAPLKKAPFKEAFFDVVTLWETVNHMTEPFDDLVCIRRFLKPGGLLALSVGDIRSRLARLMGRYWYHVTPPIHIWYFSPRTFRIFFSRIGFSLAAVEYHGKQVDLSTCLERIKDAKETPWLKNVCRFLAGSPLGRQTLYLNLRDTMYVYAKKI